MPENFISILLVEDNPINQKVAVKLLEKIGYSADIAENGVKALEALEKASYDLILMDIQMPVMNGLEATKIIRRNFESLGNRGPVIIALTANALPEDQYNCTQAGMDDFIAKPVRQEVLALTISRWFSGMEVVKQS
ncbi:MAG: response regulator [Bacteroidia bacterium]|nr:response regulator [Bacteroidia bacterium]